MNVTVSFVDKINVDELIKDFKVENLEHFQLYLQEIYRVESFLS